MANDLDTKANELEEVKLSEQLRRLYILHGWQAALVAMARLIKSGMTPEEASFFCLATRANGPEQVELGLQVRWLYIFHGWQAALAAMAKLIESGMTPEEASFFCSDVAALWVQGEDTLIALDPFSPIH